MKWILFFCFLGCVVKFLARDANSWRRKASLNPVNGVCVFFSFFFPFLLFKYFSLSNAHTHSIKYSAKTTMRKSRRRQRTQFASLDFWISGLKCLTCGVHLVELKYDLILGIVASLNSRSKSVLLPLAF